MTSKQVRDALRAHLSETLGTPPRDGRPAPARWRPAGEIAPEDRLANQFAGPAPQSAQGLSVAASSGALDQQKHRRYLLISPCRDEAQYVRRTLDSVAAQSVQPALWIIVDDGSTDGTSEILQDYAKLLPYLRIVKRGDRGARKVGPGVIEAFYAGLDTVELKDFDYVCKLDVDLDLPSGYFEVLMERMEANPRLGTTSGKPWFTHPKTGALEAEVCGDEISVGMTKFYRVACFKEIGGFVRQVMWDGIDCHRARMLGWIAESVDVESLRFMHLRPQGGSQVGILTGRMRAGFGQYFMGTAPLYYLAVAMFRLRAHPAFIGSAAMLWGYAKSWFKGLPRYDDPEFRTYLRSYQYASLRSGKRAATRRFEAERASLWAESHPPACAEPVSLLISTLDSTQDHSPSHRKTELLGTTFDMVTMDQAVDACVALCDGPRKSHIVLTANASHLCMLRRDSALAAATKTASLTVADGMSVVFALRAMGEQIPERVAGVDLMAQLLGAAADHGLSVYFLGAKQEVVARLVELSTENHPELKIAGFRNGYFTEADHPAIVETIRASGADMLFVGMPSPFKDIWCERYRDQLNVPMIMGVGGSFDVLAGFVQRAPEWVQMSGFEWFWRLLMEPRKLWKRYLTTNSEFLWLAGRVIIARRLGWKKPAGTSSFVTGS